MARYRSAFTMCGVASFDTPPTSELLSLIDEHERWIFQALLMGRHDKQGGEQEVQQYPMMVPLQQTHRLADASGVVSDLLVESQHLLCRLLLDLEVALPHLMVVQVVLKTGGDTPEKEKLAKTIAKLDLLLRIFCILAWKANTFRWYVGISLARYFQTLAPEQVEHVDPRDHLDDGNDLKPSEFADVCNHYRFEPPLVDASTSTGWLYCFRLIPCPVRLPTLVFDGFR